MTIPPPKILEGYPERALDCQLAMEPTFQDLARHAEVAGWSEDEVSAGLLELARNHIKDIKEERETAAATPTEPTMPGSGNPEPRVIPEGAQ